MTKQPLYEFGGDGPVLHLGPANGFPPQTYQPLIEPLLESYRVLSVLPRALWPNTEPPPKPQEWVYNIVPDLLSGLHEHQLDQAIVIGHSIGAITAMMAATKQPQLFKAVIVLDPTIFTSRQNWMIRLSRLINLDPPMARRAEKRRYQFADLDEALAYFKSKRLFQDWSDDALTLYCETLVPNGNGGYQLAWPRAWEAFYFRTLYTGIWHGIQAFKRTSLPLLAIRGGTSTTFTEEVVRRMQQVLPDMTFAEIDGHGHLFPMTAPEQASSIIMGWLGTLQ